MSRYLVFTPVFIAMAVFFIFGLCYYWASRRAIAGNRGGLDWIQEYGQPGIPFDRQRLTSEHHDWLSIFALVVFNVAITATYCLCKSRFYTGSWFDLFFTLPSLIGAVLSVAGAVACFWLLQDLFDCGVISVCGSLIFSAAHVGSHNSQCLLALSLLLLFRWFLTKETQPLFPRELLYYGACLFLGLACSITPEALWLGLFYMALHVYKSVRRFSAASKGAGGLILSLALALVVWGLALLAMGSCALMLRGRLGAGQLLSSLLRPELYEKLRELIPLITGRLFQRLNPGCLVPPLIDAPVVCAGFFGLLAALDVTVRRHDPRGFTALCLAGAFFLLWLVSGRYAMTVALLPAIACLWKRFTDSGRKAPVLLFAIPAVIYYIGLYVAAYGLPLCYDIVLRLG